MRVCFLRGRSEESRRPVLLMFLEVNGQYRYEEEVIEYSTLFKPGRFSVLLFQAFLQKFFKTEQKLMSQVVAEYRTER